MVPQPSLAKVPPLRRRHRHIFPARGPRRVPVRRGGSRTDARGVVGEPLRAISNDEDGVPDGRRDLLGGYARRRSWGQAFLQTGIRETSSLVVRRAAGRQAALFDCRNCRRRMRVRLFDVSMGKLFPQATLTGFDFHQQSILEARGGAAEACIANSRFLIANAVEYFLGKPSQFDAVTTFDCYHDMGNPAGIAAGIHKGL
mmetsp:Transcript_12354/g.31181  ORF Transcript_12354/g.31181 Transcript_12354/m.31181 type:complete len:200 (-) Transcript_12354:568-1167(-)